MSPRRLPFLFCLLVWCAGGAAPRPAHAAEPLTPDRHVVVVVWDGMRPDFVNEKNTPTLNRLAQNGVRFTHHHSVYLSSTHVNGASIMTGCYPVHHGVTVNYDYRPEINSRHFVSTETPDVVQKGDSLSGGKYLARPTLAELVRRQGGRTMVASAKTIGFLLDRQADSGAEKRGVTLSAGELWPSTLGRAIVSVAGFYPAFSMYRQSERETWTTRAVTEAIWKESVPALSVVWLGEPDLTEHETAPGSPEALAAIKASDENLATLLAALEEKKILDKTDIMVVSDHGFSTIARPIDVQKFLRMAGFSARVDVRDEAPKKNEVVLVGNGGSVLFYVIRRDVAVIKRLVETLQQSDFAGVLLTRQAHAGTFTMDQAMVDSLRGPDVILSFRWNDAPNQHGVPGMIASDWGRPADKGTHATLSTFDMHNTLIAAGPDFQRGQVSDLPSGNVDLAPTIAQILGIRPAPSMDGRILWEAMNASRNELPKAEPEMLEAKADLPGGKWRQTLQRTRVGATIYLDQGGGEFVPGK